MNWLILYNLDSEQYLDLHPSLVSGSEVFYENHQEQSNYQKKGIPLQLWVEQLEDLNEPNQNIGILQKQTLFFFHLKYRLIIMTLRRCIQQIQDPYSPQRSLQFVVTLNYKK